MKGNSWNEFIDSIKNEHNDSIGINIREISVSSRKIFIIYIPQITDRERLSSDIIKPIIQCENSKINIEQIANSVVYVDDISIYNEKNKLIDYVVKGNCIIILDNEERYIVANTYKVEKRSIESPQLQNVLRGPKDAFTENFDSNISLIRYRIKDSSLIIKSSTIGKRTKTSVAIIYLKDVANDLYVKQITESLSKINVDGIVESGYVQKFLCGKSKNLFPKVGLVERSDAACGEILRGKICIIVEGSNIALVMPQTLPDFLKPEDDYYENVYMSLFLKFLRISSFLASLMLSSLYIAIISFHPDILPPQYILVLAASRITVPVNTVLEITIMELVAEILKESNIRLPKQIGPAISIVGTIVIGQAAVSAGLVSALTVIIVSLSTITSFIAPDYSITYPIRILKFFMIIITGLLGLFGFVVSATIIMLTISSNNSFGISYTSPMAPMNLEDLKNYFLSDIRLEKRRPRFLKDKDETKQ